MKYRFGDELEDEELDQRMEELANYRIAKDKYELAVKEGYRSPELFYNLGRIYYLKGLYDGRRQGQRVLVTGSARLDLYRFGGDFQGRYHLLRLHTLSVAELGLRRAQDLRDLLVLGGFPEPYFGGSESEARRWSREHRTLFLRDEVASLERVLDVGKLEASHARSPQALEINPSSFEALSLRAALARAQDRPDEFNREVTELLALRPSYGEVYRLAADALAHRYRFDEALELAERAVELEPTNVRARAELGLLLLRTGDEARAREALDRAFEQDPFDVVTYNLLGLLDTLGQFEAVERGGLTVKLHPDDAAVLRELATALAGDALETLSARYAFAPRGPVLVEIFPRHDDFAVRTLGSCLA